MTKTMMPLLKRAGDRGDDSRRTGRRGSSGRNTKPVYIPKPLRITAARASSNQNLRATILNRTRIGVKNDATTRVSKLAGRKQVHGKTRNMRNIWNKKGRSRKSAPTRNRERSTISSENTKRRIKRSKRGESRRIRSHMKRSSRIQNPRGCT